MYYMYNWSAARSPNGISVTVITIRLVFCRGLQLLYRRVGLQSISQPAHSLPHHPIDPEFTNYRYMNATGKQLQHLYRYFSVNCITTISALKKLPARFPIAILLINCYGSQRFTIPLFNYTTFIAMPYIELEQHLPGIKIHDTVLIAATFCMFNRYVDGLATLTPTPPPVYEEMGKRMTTLGYVLPQKTP